MVSRTGKKEEADMTDLTRYQQLIALANDGDENAIADLFTEFGYPYPASAQK